MCREVACFMHETADDVIASFAESPAQKLVLQSKTIFWKVFFIKLCFKILLPPKVKVTTRQGIAREALQLKEVKRLGYIWFSCIPDKVVRDFHLFWRFHSDVRWPRALRRDVFFNVLLTKIIKKATFFASKLFSRPSACTMEIATSKPAIKCIY